jgi:hypothetical protein
MQSPPVRVCNLEAATGLPKTTQRHADSCFAAWLLSVALAVGGSVEDLRREGCPSQSCAKLATLAMGGANLIAGRNAADTRCLLARTINFSECGGTQADVAKWQTHGT